MGRLISIELCDFKSYRGEQKVEFGDAFFTSIIGPNGSGKSNMMDAISFVLGVRSKQLRSDYLHQLIYRGRILASEEEDENGAIRTTQSDDPRSCYVKLTYEKSPTEILELKRTVRATGRRGQVGSGTSEYFINDEKVGEKDYQDILAGENIIVKAKNFLVFQGDVEKTAAMKPGDLATLIERVSGSIEYQKEYERLQKEMEAKGKESTAAYQRRKEYNAELKQYRDQTKEVEEYNSKVDERSNLQTNLILWKLFHIEKDIDVKKNLIKEFEQQIKESSNEVRAVEDILEEANSKFANSSSQYRNLERKYAQYNKKIELRQQEALPINEKIKMKKDQNKEVEKRIESVQKDLDRQKDEVKSVNKGFAVLEKAKEKFENESREKLKSLIGLRDVSDDILKEYESLNSDYKLQTSLEQSKLESLLRNKQTDLDKLSSLNSKSEETKVKISSLKQEIDDVKGVIKVVSSSINDDNDDLQNKKIELHKISSGRADRQRKISELNSQLSTVVRQLLDHNTNKRESEKVLKLKEDTESLKRLFPGVKGLVNELLEPKEKRYQTAISTVLGRNFDSIVVDSQKTARECINYLKEQRKGICSFIPLDTIQISPIPSSMRTLGRNVRLAIDTVDFKPEIERAVQFVCDNSLICDTIDLAKEMKWQRNIHAMMVTLDGTIIHKGNMISGGVSDNRNADRWEQKDIRGMEKLKDKLQNDLRELTNKKNEHSSKEEELITLISGLEMKLNDSKNKFQSLNLSLESRQNELKHVIQINKQLTPEINQLNEIIENFNNEIGKIEEQVLKIKHSTFSSFCKKISISSIDEFEQAQTSHIEELNKKRIEFSNQHNRLQTRLNFESNRIKQTEKRIENLKQEFNKNEEMINQLRSQRKVITNEINQLQSDQKAIKEKVEELKSTMESRKSTADDYLKQVHEIRSNHSKLVKKLTIAQEDISKDGAKRLDLLNDCKINGQSIPLLEGSLDSIPIKEIMRNEDDDDDEDDDIEMADIDPSQTSDTSMYGIVIEYKSLPENLRSSSDPIIEQEIQEEISSLTSQLDNMVVNSRASDHLEEASTKFKEASKDSQITNDEHRAIRKQFEEVKQKRSKAFNNAFNQISKSIDGIYKELTRNKSFPTGGSANLYWENEGEDFAKGIIYNVQPPMKQFCEIEQLSGGEKTMAALALLFAIHRFHPSPFFILDEIDAALDNNNIASIGRYIKHNAKENFQFIVISLKNGLFEKSDSLVGIYRDQDINSSKALTLDLRQWDIKPVA